MRIGAVVGVVGVLLGGRAAAAERAVGGFTLTNSGFFYKGKQPALERIAATVEAAPAAKNCSADVLACVEDAGSGATIRVTLARPIPVDAIAVVVRAPGEALVPKIEVGDKTITPVGQELSYVGGKPVTTLTVTLSHEAFGGRATSAYLEEIYLGAAGKRVEIVPGKSASFVAEIGRVEAAIRDALKSAKAPALEAVVAFPLEWDVRGDAVAPRTKDDGEDPKFESAKALAAWLKKNPPHDPPLPRLVQYDEELLLENHDDACASWSWTLVRQGTALKLSAVHAEQSQCSEGE